MNPPPKLPQKELSNLFFFLFFLSRKRVMWLFVFFGLTDLTGQVANQIFLREKKEKNW